MLVVEELVKVFRAHRRRADGGVMALDHVSFTVERGSLFTLLGPSGCGKTTTLRSIAGLESPDSGEIRLDERVLYSASQGVRVPANRRGLGMVFQSYAIWPHMNVRHNVAYPLTVGPRRRRPPRAEVRERVERALAIVQLGHLAARPATSLSGGQQQRLALARALVMEPPLLLLDEPLSNLDAKLREEMRFELQRLQRDLGITAVYVTHDQVEALAISSQVAVMRDGVIEQVGRPREVYERPASRFVAEFIGTTNILEGSVRSREAGGRYRIDTPEGLLLARSEASFEVGERVLASLRPERIELSTGMDASVGPNRWKGRVQSRAYVGEAVDHLLVVGDTQMRARSGAERSVPDRTDVLLSFAEDACCLLPKAD